MQRAVKYTSVSCLFALVAGAALPACPEPPADGPDIELSSVEAEVTNDEGVGTFEIEVEVAAPETDATPSDPDTEVTPLGCASDAGESGCDDGNPCTDDVCRPSGVCAHTPNIELCDDADACTTFDRCTGGVCIGSALDCDDGEPCTRDTCADGACGHAAAEGPCDDGDLCTQGDRCADGACVGVAVVCAGGPCANARCEPREGCLVDAVEDGWACDDGNACTAGTVCVGGVCKGALVACDDGDVCTDDYCDTEDGCRHRANKAACDDGDRCTTDDRCDAGVCAGAAAGTCCADDAVCDDGDACTDDRCEGADCVHVVRGCDDGDGCTRDACEAGSCVSTPWATLPAEGQLVDDFEGALDAWAFTSDNAAVGWRRDEAWAASGSASLYVGDAAGGGYDHGATRAEARRAMLVPPGEAALHLSVKSDVTSAGSCIYDALAVLVDGVAVGVVCGSGEGEHTMSLAAFAGREVELALVFDTVDDVDNGGLGVWVDRLRVTSDGCP